MANAHLSESWEVVKPWVYASVPRLPAGSPELLWVRVGFDCSEHGFQLADLEGHVARVDYRQAVEGVEAPGPVGAKR